MSAGQQIDKRIDEKLTTLDAKVKSIIKETVKNQYIKKESFAFDESLFEDDTTQAGGQFQHTQGFQRRSSSSSKRYRQQEAIHLRSPNTPSQRKKKADTRQFFQNTLGVIYFEYIFQKLKYE